MISRRVCPFTGRTVAALFVPGVYLATLRHSWHGPDGIMWTSTLSSMTAAVLSFSLIVGCSTREKPKPRPVANAVSASTSITPPDRLAPGELPIGPIKAFGLPTPRGFHEHFRGAQVVEVDGLNEAEAVANFVRSHATYRTVETGAARTIFDSAKAKGSDIPLRIEVVTLAHGTRLIVRDMRKLRVDPSLTDEQRWKKYGFDKNGRLLHPEKMQ